MDDREGEWLVALRTDAKSCPGAVLVTRRASILALEADQSPHLSPIRL
jgi:hypothetical protein